MGKQKSPSYDEPLDPAVVGWCETRPTACDGNCEYAKCSNRRSYAKPIAK
jgi:hypothetical protein